MNEINEKLSALYDGELNAAEVDELIDIISKEKSLQKQISMYSLIGAAVSQQSSNDIALDAKKNIKNAFSNLWFSNALTAAASVLLTLTFVNNVDFSRMDINTNSSKQISSAINSKEAKNTAEKSNEYLADHIMNIINDPNYMSSKNPLDLQNVGYKSNSDNGYIHSKGNESFQLRIENKNFGIKQIRYWKHGNKMIYLVPLNDGRVLTLYGNISLSSALSIAESVNK